MKSQLASRIFRTVVMSSAMLATPIVAHADQVAPPPQKKEAPKAPEANAKPAMQPDTWESVTALLVENDKKLDKAVTGLVKARKDMAAKKKDAEANLATANATLADVHTERTSLTDRLAKLTRPTPVNEAAMPGVEKAETSLADAETKLFAAVETKDASDADWPKNTKAIEAANKTRVSAAAKVKTERAKLNKRPRAQAVERPVGRGFVLS
jgi:chromosome segregation ATPase